jgi:hypothetical protein
MCVSGRRYVINIRSNYVKKIADYRYDVNNNMYECRVMEPRNSWMVELITSIVSRRRGRCAFRL